MTHLGRRLLHVFLHQGFSNLHGAIGLHRAAMYPDFNRLYCAALLKAWPWKSDPLLRQPAETTKKIVSRTETVLILHCQSVC